MIFMSKDKLEYQKNLRFIREAAEAKAKLGSPALKLTKVQQESDLTKPVLTLGDKDNKVPPVKEPKSANEVPETRETSRVSDPVKAGEHGDNCLDVNLDDIDYARISEGRGISDTYHDRFSDGGYRKHKKDKRISTDEGLCVCDEEDCAEGLCDPECDACCNKDSLFEDARRQDENDEFDAKIRARCSCDQEDCANGFCDPECEACLEFFERPLSEATKRQKDAKQSLARHKVATKNKRTKSMKHKSNASLKKENTMTLGDVFLNELSSFNKEELPGSGDISKQMKEFDDLLQKFTKEALELHKKFTEELKVDPLGGLASPQMAPRIGERNRMLMVRAGILRKLAAAAVAGVEACRREG